ncbi:MAG TPA: carbohydrate ABC transporter permease [Ruminiclostridium sp.]
MNKPASKRKSSTVILEIALFIVAALIVFPIILLFITTFKEAKDLYNPFSIPNFGNFENYIKVFKTVNVPLAFGNTIIITVSTIVINILISSMAGYAISRSKEKAIKLLFFYFVFGLIIPFQSSMIITFKLGMTLHLINTRTFLILQYIAGGCAYAIMLYVGFTKNIPKELEEAASIDGYGPFSIFFKIVFPLLRPATLTLATITVFWYWNDFSGPLIYLNDKAKSTIMYSIFMFQLDQRSTAVGPVYTLCFLSIIPVFLFFIIAQKYLVEGLVAGAVKG